MSTKSLLEPEKCKNMSSFVDVLESVEGRKYLSSFRNTSIGFAESRGEVFSLDLKFGVPTWSQMGNMGEPGVNLDPSPKKFAQSDQKQ